MSNRTAKFVAAIFAGFVAGAPLATISQGATPAADDCLAGPKDQAPLGSHWYYRLDHATKRHCWYLKDERDKLSQLAPNSSPSAKPVSPQADAAMPRSIANAHAELTPAQPPVGQDTNPVMRPPAASEAASVAGTDDSAAANAEDANPRQSVVAWRWPDSPGVNSSAATAPTTDGSGAPAPTNSAAARRPDIGAVSLAVADSSTEASETPSGSIRMLLMILIGALTLAGILAGAIFRFVNTHWRRQRGLGGDRRAIWDSAGSGRPSSPAYPYAGRRPQTANLPRELRRADDADDRIAEMLARLSRSRTN